MAGPAAAARGGRGRPPRRGARALAAGVLIAAGAAAAAGPAGAAPAGPGTRIIGGRPAAEGAYPWMVRLGFGASGQCGGSLVSPDIVITAHHCLEYAKGLTADIGRVRWKDAEPAGARRTSTPDRWRLGGGPKVGDWAVVRLDRPYAGAAPVALPRDGALDAAPAFRALGWGHTEPTGSPNSETLNEVDLPLVGQNRCPDFNGKKEGWEICAGDWDNGGIDSCTNDSGGPLIARDGERWVLVGIVSWGWGCAQKQRPGHYVAVSRRLAQLRAAIVELGGQPPPGW
ncbi:trypsin [Pilimelia anulata]|uniref:Trypsin n=1 Tax=Pilimelia anulata TaxID=53371 RepID=A0A8J3B9Z4_9ACTN|nr:serine protease [Pilimelia anulata]GGK03803.1 trypsin [Pilimelia anulata]